MESTHELIHPYAYLVVTVTSKSFCSSLVNPTVGRPSGLVPTAGHRLGVSTATATETGTETEIAVGSQDDQAVGNCYSCAVSSHYACHEAQRAVEVHCACHEDQRAVEVHCAYHEVPRAGEVHCGRIEAVWEISSHEEESPAWAIARRSEATGSIETA